MRSDPSELLVDFTSGAVAHRFRFGGGRGQALPKAVGLKSGNAPVVVDATAGLGRDAFLLASLGAQVTMIERSDHMHALLADGLTKARAFGGEIGEIALTMKLLHGDSKTLLRGLSPEVILVDPMHPPRKKSALVKKELRLIRDVVGEDPDAVDLMNVALASAKNRVVLKWPQKADPMEGIRTPSHQITGKSTRYDVFMIG